MDLLVPSLVAAALLVMLMAKRRDRNFISIPFTQSTSLGAMAAGACLEDILLDTLLQPLRVISVDITARVESINNEAVTLQFGLSHSAYTTAQIVECIDARPVSRDDKVAIEQTNRLVRPVGTVHKTILADEDTGLWIGGDEKRVRLNWRVGQPESLAVWMINRTGSTLTTGGVFNIEGTAYCRWL